MATNNPAAAVGAVSTTATLEIAERSPGRKPSVCRPSNRSKPGKQNGTTRNSTLDKQRMLRASGEDTALQSSHGALLAAEQPVVRVCTCANQKPLAHTGILGVIGRTPVIRLDRLDADTPVSIHAKLEFLNPGGSMKDRPALAMIRAALATGQLEPGGLVIESSSGNMGIGLAQACAYLGLQFICVIDPKTTATNRRLLAAYGAQLSPVSKPHRITGDFLDARLERVDQLMGDNPGAFRPNQYDNPNNVDAHFQTTAQEFFKQMGGLPDVILAATSTCGTLAGFQRYVEQAGGNARLIAVDAQGSRLFRGVLGSRNIPGLGSSKETRQLDPDSVEVLRVDDTDCVLGCQILARKEAIMAGGSSGGVVVAALRIAPTLPAGSKVAVLLPDRGERYLDTVYSSEWVSQHCPDLDARRTEFA